MLMQDGACPILDVIAVKVQEALQLQAQECIASQAPYLEMCKSPFQTDDIAPFSFRLCLTRAQQALPDPASTSSTRACASELAFIESRSACMR